MDEGHIWSYYQGNINSITHSLIMDKRESLKEMRQKIADMITASKRRQKGKDVTSEDISKRRERRESGMGKPGTIGQGGKTPGDRAQSESGYMPDKGKDNKPKEKAKPRQRRGAGREDMMSRQRQDTIMRREEEKKKKAQGIGGGTVVG